MLAPSSNDFNCCIFTAGETGATTVRVSLFFAARWRLERSGDLPQVDEGSLREADRRQHRDKVRAAVEGDEQVLREGSIPGARGHPGRWNVRGLCQRLVDSRQNRRIQRG